MTEENVEIPLEDENKPVEVVIDETGKKAAEPKAAASAEAQGIDDLKAEVERARKEANERRLEADRKIREAYEKATRAEQEVVEVKKDAIDGTIERLKVEKDAAKRDLKTAIESNNADAIADAQDRLSMANTRMVEAEKGKVALEEEAKAPKQAPQITVADNSIDVVVRNLEANGNPRSAAWIRSHPEYAGSGPLNNKLTAAHYWALSEGHPVETDGYFKAIEEQLGLGQARNSKPNADIDTRGPISAPVTRSTPSNGGSRSKSMPASIRLTPEEVNTAKELGMDLKAYANHLWQLSQEGKINRAF